MKYSHGTKKISTMALSVMLALSVGCDVEVEGEEGNFTFTYLNSKTTNANDLAKGAKVDVRVIDADTEQAVDLSEVFTEDADTLEVIEQDDRSFTLEAKGEGTVRVTAEAETDEETEEVISDSFEMRSAEVSSVGFDQRCDDAVFLADAGGRMQYEMFDGTGGELTGYGHYPVFIEPADDLLPIDLEDPGEINEDYHHLGSLEFSTASEPGTYAMVSELNGEREEFEVIAASDVDEMMPFTGEEATGSVSAGEVQQMAAMFTMESGDDEVCGPLGDALEITTETPELCEADYFMPFEDIGALSLHSLEVAGLEPGTCEIAVSLPETDVSLDVTVTVD